MAAQARTITSALSSSKATMPSLKKLSSKSASSVWTSSFCALSSSPAQASWKSGSRSLSASGAARCLRRLSASSRMTSSKGATTGSASLTSMRFIGLEDRSQVPLLQRENIGLRLLPQSAPDDRAALLMHLQHLLAGGLLVEAEDFFEDHHDIRHQVDRVVQDDDPP